MINRVHAKQDHGRYGPIHCFLGITSIPSRVFSFLYSPTSAQKLFSKRSQSWKFSVGSQLRSRKFNSVLGGGEVARYHTCCRDRRNHTTVFEDELGMIAGSMNHVPSQSTPGRVSVHRSTIRKRNGGRTHSPSVFRAAAITSERTHSRLRINETTEQTCRQNTRSPQAVLEAMVYVSSSACPSW